MYRFMIVYETRTLALEKVAAAIQPYLDYVVPCGRERTEGWNAVKLVIDPGMTGYTIDVDPPDGERQDVTLTAADEVNLYYAASDFANIYLPYARAAGRHGHPYYFYDLFRDPLKPYHVHSEPRIAHRGIWLWGYTVYDYRRFIENMASLKLNTLILWNDCLPVNITDVIEYAKRFGIAVYLGFAWGWDTTIPPSLDDAYLARLTAGITAEYEEKYAALGCAGIYFQTFTELSRDTIGGRLVADAAVDLVNRTSSALLEAHPGLEILFGLHATSVKTHLDIIARTDSRVRIVWENCGAFPYAYLFESKEDFGATVDFTRKLIGLNGAPFGAVLKGITALDWEHFHHLEGEYVMGRADRAFIRRRTDEKRDILRYLQANWIKNAHFARDMIREYPRDSMITCLVEDGMFEEVVNYPAALYAAMLWDPDRPAGDILAEVAARPDVDFV